VSLISRYLEANGMPTVIIGSALDIVEHCAVPRYLFVDFPLGNPCGRPWDAAMQLSIVRQGVELLRSAPGPKTTVRAPHRWGDDGWRRRYMEVSEDNRAELARQGEILRRDRRTRQPRQETP